MATGAHVHGSNTSNTWFPVSTTVSMWTIPLSKSQQNSNALHYINSVHVQCDFVLDLFLDVIWCVWLSKLVFAPIRNHCPWKKPSDSWLRPKPLVHWSHKPQLLSKVAHQSLEVWGDLMDWTDGDATDSKKWHRVVVLTGESRSNVHGLLVQPASQ